MKERPILFTAAMVRALLDGRKGQTRRIVTPQPEVSAQGNLMGDWLRKPLDGLILPKLQDITIHCPYGVAGDHLWVREAWRTTGDGGRVDDMPPRDLQPHTVWYEADGVAPADQCVGKYRPAMFMPRWASRITLEVTGVRVEQLQAINERDASAEGVVPTWSDGIPIQHDCTGDLCRPRFRELWDSLNDARGYGWDTNPWVWVVEFKRIDTASKL